MKLTIIFQLLLALFISGCQNDAQTGSASIDSSRVAGTWKAENYAWEITISEDLTVESAVFPTGKVLLRPNKVTEKKMRDGSISTYKAGSFTCNYDPETNELEVAIEVPEFHIRYLKNRIDGSFSAEFVGTVSESGRVWDGFILEIFDYGPRFPQKPEDIVPVPIRLNKVDN